MLMSRNNFISASALAIINAESYCGSSIMRILSDFKKSK